MTDGRPPLVITGATGRIGQLVLATAAPGLAVIRTARRPGPQVDMVWDLAGPVPALPRGAVILHLAALLSGPGDLVEGNLALLRGVMRAAGACQAARVLIASSAAVYGAQEGPGEEDGLARPLSRYGQAKLATEHAARAWAGTVPVTVLRIGNVPGADALLGRGRQGTVTLDPAAGQPAGPLRSWIGPGRLAQALFALAGQAGGALPDCVNLASDPPLAMGDVLTAAGIPWQFGPPRPETLPRATLSTRRLRALLPQAPVTAADLVADWRSALRASA